MKLPVYSIRDVKGESFNQLTVGSNDHVMMRSLAENLISKRDPIMAFAPSDFVLYRVGTFDIEKGIIESENPIVYIATGSEVISNYAKQS